MKWKCTASCNRNYLQKWRKNNSTHTHTHTQPFYGPFSGTTRVSRCRKKSSSGLYGAREDIRGRHANHPAGHHSIRTNQRPTSLIPHFYAGCPSCHDQVVPMCTPLHGGSRPHLIHGSLGPPEFISWIASWTVQPLCRVHNRDRQTDRQTTLLCL